MKFKGVIFDLDGTLIDSIEDLADSMNIVLRDMGFPGHDIDSYKYFVGNAIKALAFRALPAEHRDNDTVAKCIAGMKEEYAKRSENKTRPYGGIPELIGRFTAAGLKTAILSNKFDESVKSIVSKLFPGCRFDAVLGVRPNVPIKPDPSAALEIASYLNISPKDFLFIGDTDVDMQTATSAGMYAVGVLWGFRKADELVKGGARILVKRPEDLSAWI